MAKGKPSKSGKRTKAGRLSRAGRGPLIVKGNDKAEQRKAIYGTNGGDPLGRAYVMGLLGEGDIAKDRLDIARKFGSIYTRVYRKPYRCPLNDNPRGGDDRDCSDYALAQEEWMKNNAALIDNARRLYFDQLVIPVHPLDDPHWLARLLAIASNCPATAREKQIVTLGARIDVALLTEALRGIDALKVNPPERVREWELTRPARCARGRN